METERERGWRELREALLREASAWTAKPPFEVLRTLAKGQMGFDVEYLGRPYHLVVSLLDSNDEVLTVSLELPDDPGWIAVIAEPRPPGSGGWTNEETGCASTMLFLQRS